MKLAIPIFFEGKTYDAVDVIKPRSGVISNANKEKRVNPFNAMKVFIAGCISSMSSDDGSTVNDKAEIMRSSGAIPYKTAEQILYEIFSISNEDDGIEGIYYCPRCKKKIICEDDKQNEIDSRDFISDLPLVMMEEPTSFVDIELSEEVLIIDSRTKAQVDDTEEIKTISLRYPTIRDCMMAFQFVGDNDEGKLQFEIYKNSLIKVNGSEIDNKYRNRWGSFIFNNIPEPSDLKKISDKLSYFGVSNLVKKNCPSCGKVWEVALDTSCFFDSALRTGS